MPPVRTLSIPVKPVKTERTHEENQERAYIAASRRSDRSLEARVESARRASEIHKRRTGRSLRVTEQDVVNEEMYEEEDDDLPMQYRRLTAHLNTNSSDFNRRLAAYLSNHVAMRSALDQAISSSYNQQNPQYPNHLPASASGPFRSSPYPAPGAPGYRPSLKSQVADSLAQGAKFINSQSKQQQSPADAQTLSSAIKQSPVSTPSSDNNNSVPQPPSLRRSDNSASSNTPSENHPRPQSNFQSSNNQNWASPPMDMSCSPLTTQLPPDAQSFFGAGFGNNDSYGQNLFSDDKSHPFFSYDHSSATHPYISGMNQTLAPAALDAPDSAIWSNPAPSDNFFSSNYPFGLDQEFNHDPFSKPSFNTDSNQFSGQLTPADHEWSSFIDANSWDDNET